MNENVDLQSITSDTELKALLWDQQEALETIQSNARAIQERRQQLAQSVVSETADYDVK